MKKFDFFVACVISCITAGSAFAYGSSDGSSSSHNYMATGTVDNSNDFMVVPCVYSDIQPLKTTEVMIEKGDKNCATIGGFEMIGRPGMDCHNSITLRNAGVSCLYNSSYETPCGVKVDTAGLCGTTQAKNEKDGYVNLGYLISNTPYSRDAEIRITKSSDRSYGQPADEYTAKLNSNLDNVNLCTSDVLCDTATQNWFSKDGKLLYLIFKI